MVFTFAPDFVIKNRRKRSRQAVDPCLGFYQDISNSPNVSVSATTMGSHFRTPSLNSSPNLKLAHIVNWKPQNRSPSGENGDRVGTSAVSAQSIARVREDVQATLTADQIGESDRFPRVAKRYRCARFKVPQVQSRSEELVEVDLHDPDYHNDTYSEYSSPPPQRRKRVASGGDDDYAPPKPPLKRRRRQKVQSLSARLLTEAVLTGVDIVGGPLRLAAATRRPLQFVPEHRATSPVTKLMRGHLVDPRKAMPFDRVDFQFAEHIAVVQAPSGHKQGPRPVTAWQPVNADNSVSVVGLKPPSQQHDLMTTDGLVVARLVTAPLTMVPMTDPRSIEHVSRRRFDDARKHQIAPRPKGKDVSPIPILPLEPSVCLSPPQSRRRMKKNALLFVLNSSPPLSPRSDVISSPRHLDGSVSGSLDLFLSHPPDVVPDPDEINDACEDESARQPPPLLTPPVVENENAVERSLHTDGPLATDSEQTTQLDPPAPFKSMKSLVSLLDSFREIARSVTQQSLAPDYNKTLARPPPSTSSTPNLSALRSASRLAPMCAAVPYRPVSLSMRSALLPSEESLPMRRLRARVTRAHQKSADGDIAFLDENMSGGVDISHSIAIDSSPPAATQDCHDTVGHSVSLQMRQKKKTVYLPSSPLPGWSTLSIDME